MASAKAAAPPAPPAQPPQGTHGPRNALAPTLVDMPATAPNPVKEANDRQKAAIEKMAASSDRAKVEAAGEDKPATPPKAPAGESSSSSTKTPSEGSTSTKSETKPAEAPKPAESKSAETTTTTEPAKEPKFTLKNIRKWAEENPEEAAEVRNQVFKADADSTAEWVRLTNKKRKMVGDLTKREQEAMAAAEAKLTEAKSIDEKVTTAGKQLAPIADLWGATKESIVTKPDGTFDYSRVDFDAGDAAFKENSGISIDDYMRARARRGVVSPDMAKLRAENARLKREAESAKPAAKETEKTSEPEKPAAKPVSTVDWGAEIPKGHKLRQLAGWETDFADEMEQYHDPKLDEYSADPEEVADKVLKRKLAAMAGDEEAPEVKPRPKVKVAAKAAEAPTKPRPKPIAELPEDGSDAPKDFAARERWAIERAMKRARGEVVA